MLIKDKIKLNTIQQKVGYEIFTLKRTIINGVKTERQSKEIFDKEFFSTDHKGDVFRVQLQERKATHSNELDVIESKLALLNGGVMVRTNSFGEITEILNLKNIENFWSEKKSKFYNNHKKFKGIDQIMAEISQMLQDHNAFLKVIQESVMATTLFPPIDNTALSEKQNTQQKKTFTEFFDKEMLPFEMFTSISNFSKYSPILEIMRKGVLNPYTFQAEKVKAYLKKRTKIPITLTAEKVVYVETFDLDMFHWVDKTNQALIITIKDVFEQHQVIRVKSLYKAL